MLPRRRATAALVPMAPLLVAAGAALGVAHAAQAQADAGQHPADHCRRVGLDDTLRPLPASLAPAAARLFGLRAPDTVVRRTTVFRCMGGAVLVCNTGANLPCGKANTSRDLPAAGQYCRERPGSPFIPTFVTGHDSVYRWRCEGAEAVAEGPAERVDERGFVARLWKPVAS